LFSVERIHPFAGLCQLIGFLCADLEFLADNSDEQFPIRYALCHEDGANFRIDERDKIEIRETDNRNRLGIA
jgi:hypothetical protein